MHNEDVKPTKPKTWRFSLQEIAELKLAIERLRPKPDLLKRCQAAAYIADRGATNYTAKALANLASRGLGPPYFKLGNDTYYLEHDLDAWLYSKRIVPSKFYYNKTGS